MEFSLIRDGSSPQDRLEVAVVEDGDPVVIRVVGKMLYDTLQPLADILDLLCCGPCPRLILDLSEVPTCDSSGLNLLAGTLTNLTSAGGWLRLAVARPMVAGVLQITNLIRVLPPYVTVDETRLKSRRGRRPVACRRYGTPAAAVRAGAYRSIRFAPSAVIRVDVRTGAAERVPLPQGRGSCVPVRPLLAVGTPLG
ncbi:STAS domain-containing protein [Dactylosporangium sp. NPDC049525]|uniref:STAS domain-containing protein n=1 Tax=Dactylosporangium sp. NPDC049525 TaxID=3154730 RepID=UPI003448D2CB